MKVLVCGSRGIDDYDVVDEAIDDSRWNPDTIIHGGARGVDSSASMYARIHNIDEEEHAVPEWAWETIGGKAGPIRNGYMVSEADAMIAVWDGDSSGTQNAIQQAMDEGIPIYKFLCTDVDDGWVVYRRCYEDGDQSDLTEFC